MRKWACIDTYTVLRRNFFILLAFGGNRRQPVSRFSGSGGRNLDSWCQDYFCFFEAVPLMNNVNPYEVEEIF
ncbi:hypothetical protein TNCV_4705591 [Trichonephila clavipes]|nr:hypothetical protein TNCV_4705591 [Trichonephila clavipes]